jgi:hypothetical protein
VAHYKSKKLKKLEHKNGEVSKSQYNNLMRVVPPSPAVINSYKEVYKDKVDYEEILPKSATLFKQMMDEWYKWYEDQTNIAPKIDGVAGKHMKQLIAHLRKLSASDEEVMAVFRSILYDWEKLPEFYQEQREIRQINSNVNIILTKIKHGQTKGSDISEGFRANL